MEKPKEIIKYSIAEASENPNESIIRKEGVIIDFPLGDIDRNLNQLDKAKKECEGAITLANAKIKNVAEHHPFVMKLSAEDLVAAYIFAEATTSLNQAKAKLLEVENQITADVNEKADILVQLPELAKAVPKVEAVDQNKK